MNIQSISEKVPIEETLKGIEFIKDERNIDKLKFYMDEILPFGEKTTVKYRNKFIKRFVELEGNEIIYSPLMKFINGSNSFQTKKEIVYFIVCVTSDAIGEIVKGFHGGIISEIVESEKLFEVFKAAMPDAKESSVKKTFNVTTTILGDFGILNKKNTENTHKKIFVLNSNNSASNEGILFNLYYEFLKIKSNKMPDDKLILNSDTFKYFIMSDLMKKKYLKWMLDNNYLEHYVMGGNSKYQFTYDSIDNLVERVVSDD